MKTMKQLKKLSFVDRIDNENEDGYWMYLKEGYINCESGCRIIHEHTVKDLNDKLTYVIPVKKT